MNVIPTFWSSDANLIRGEFEVTVKKLKNTKAVGPDEVPAEVFKYCPKIRDEFFNLIEYIWNEEYVPKNMACGRFVMIWKKRLHR